MNALHADTADCPTCLPGALIGAGLAAFASAVLVKAMLLASAPPLPLPLMEGCSLERGACEARLPDGGTVSLSLTPRPLPLTSPLTAEALVADSTARVVSVTFSGVDFPMASSPEPFAARGAGSYDTRATLPVCAYGRMEWRATLLLEQDGQRWAVPFRFFTDQTR